MKNPDQFIYVQVYHNGIKQYLRLDVYFLFEIFKRFTRDFPNMYIVIIYSIIAVLNENLVKMKKKNHIKFGPIVYAMCTQ